MLVASLIVGIAICFGVPIVGLVLLMRKRRGTGKAFAWGAAAFVVSQLLIRIPVLQFVLPNFGWFAVMQLYPWRYGLFLGLTAGLADTLIDRVYVYPGNRVEIAWKMKDFCLEGI